jgi:cytochrome b subunit of formate dehydrogenase
VGETKKDNLTRFNRLLVWPILVLFIILAVSGYGITNQGLTSELTGGVFTRDFSLYLHKSLVLPALTLLMIHVLISLKKALTRWGIEEGNLLNGFLILLGAFTLALLVLLQYLVF